MILFSVLKQIIEKQKTKNHKKNQFLSMVLVQKNGRKGTRIEMVFPFLNYLKIEP